MALDLGPISRIIEDSRRILTDRLAHETKHITLQDLRDAVAVNDFDFMPGGKHEKFDSKKGQSIGFDLERGYSVAVHKDAIFLMGPYNYEIKRFTGSDARDFYGRIVDQVREARERVLNPTENSSKRKAKSLTKGF